MEQRKVTTGSATATTGKLKVKPGFSQSGPARQPQEFERFADLTRKLVRVPKAEVDEKRQT